MILKRPFGLAFLMVLSMSPLLSSTLYAEDMEIETKDRDVGFCDALHQAVKEAINFEGTPPEYIIGGPSTPSPLPQNSHKNLTEALDTLPSMEKSLLPSPQSFKKMDFSQTPLLFQASNQPPFNVYENLLMSTPLHLLTQREKDIIFKQLGHESSSMSLLKELASQGKTGIEIGRLVNSMLTPSRKQTSQSSSLITEKRKISLQDQSEEYKKCIMKKLMEYFQQ